MDKLKIEYVDINTIKPYKNNANTYSVYMHLFPNNKVYIGITKFKPEYRWNNGEGYKRQPYIYKAIQKYGWNNIEHIILENNLDERSAKLKEKQYIKLYNSNNKKYGYNLTDGGEGTVGYHLTEKHIKKIIECNHTRIFKEESKEKLRKANAQYKEWRNEVFKRDNYICQNCGRHTRDLEAHHIKAQSKYPELIYDVDNGLTLCHECHKLTDNYGYKERWENFTGEKAIKLN